ncbi:PREDICTED: forkhead box protein F2-like, partial [Merops nubicus]|uniref:forkhead box protein F2-like n=1 Tax=Merops nubicus TaxID=57421 RepID=UPI0004F03BB2
PPPAPPPRTPTPAPGPAPPAAPANASSGTGTDSDVTHTSGALSFTSSTSSSTLQCPDNGGVPLSVASTRKSNTLTSSKSSVPVSRISPVLGLTAITSFPLEGTKLVAVYITSLLLPKSGSVAFTRITSVPSAALSGSCTLYTDWLNCGALSFASSTSITSSIVP